MAGCVDHCLTAHGLIRCSVSTSAGDGSMAISVHDYRPQHVREVRKAQQPPSVGLQMLASHEV